MEQNQKRGAAAAAAMLPSPKSGEKPGRDLRPAEANGTSGAIPKCGDKEKGVNVQVILRCRPLSEEEVRSNTPVVISCNDRRREVSATQIIANKQIDRTFAFDKVFGPASKQKDLFEQSISPIVNEVLEGYNCTIFAYGQTGTGKTYTMEGGGSRKTKNGDLPSDAGVIPRAVRRIFDVLEAQCAEYSMKVTFLELYNEEITDLLAADDAGGRVPDDKGKKPIALMEDGKGGVFVRGLEEEVVYSAGEIYKILDKGSARRRTAETLLNKQSSRSHSIFSITIHIKECTPEGEEMIKIGKLNLVDLAGSENISRSGAKDGRAREAGEINKSLLTLGRVINALVEHSGHVPYRDSKLTRLLRDSLGGKTKTCIIATITPSIYCLEETLSTLDYAHRAKNIKNRPEVNQKMMKTAMIKDLYYEIDRLKQEVFAAREKNGIYIPRDRYLQEEAEKKAMTEKIERLEVDMEAKDKQLVGLRELYDSQQVLCAELSRELEKTQREMKETENALLELEKKHEQAQCTIKEKEFLILNLLKSEKSLVERAYELRSELENAASDVSGLFLKIERKDKIEDGNRVLVQKFRSQLTNQLDTLHGAISASVVRQESHLKEMEEDMRSFVSSKTAASEILRARLQGLRIMYDSAFMELDGLAGEIDGNSRLTFDELNAQVQLHSSELKDCFSGFALEADHLLGELQGSLSEQGEKLAHFVRKQHEGYLRTVEATRSISSVTTSFFASLDDYSSKLSSILKDSEAVQERKLLALERKFEECAAAEERQLLEKLAEMLANSNARKKELVQSAVDSLRTGAAERTDALRTEISTASDFAATVKGQWRRYMDETEENYREDTSVIERGRASLLEVLRECQRKTSMSSEQWGNTRKSLTCLGDRNVQSVNSIVGAGTSASQELRVKLSSSVSTTLEDIELSTAGLLDSIDGSLKLDNDACSNIYAITVPFRSEVSELKSRHGDGVAAIAADAGKCLQEEYLLDEPSCSTPRRRDIKLPSATAIDELRTPDFEDLLKSFKENKLGDHALQPAAANGDVMCFSSPFEDSPAPQSMRDMRVPVTALT